MSFASFSPSVFFSSILREESDGTAVWCLASCLVKWSQKAIELQQGVVAMESVE